MNSSKMLTLIEARITVLQNDCDYAENMHRLAVKNNSDGASGYHWGRMSGLSDAITALKCIKDAIESDTEVQNFNEN